MTVLHGRRALADRDRAQVPDGQVTVTGPDGPRTSWEGAVMIKPADAKVPVFTVLRNNGWRPRRDWFGARLFEK